MIYYLATLTLLTSVFLCGCDDANTTLVSRSKGVSDFLTIPEDRQPQGKEYSRGKEILNGSMKSYARLESYVGEIQVSSLSKYSVRTFRERRNLKVHYNRPGNLRLEGRDSNDDPFVVSIDGERAYINWNGKIEQYGSPEKALYAFSGITLYGSLVLPGCLLHIAWQNEEPLLPANKSLFESWATKARFIGNRELDGHDCFHIVCERDIVTWTIFVDVENKLIRRADCEITEAQMQRLRSIGAGGGASGRLLAISRSQLFPITEVRWVEKGASNERGNR